jgi:hypothetical protein
LEVTDQVCNEHITKLESAAAVFDKSSETWKPQVDESLASVKLELTKLNSFFDRDAKQSANSKPGVLQIESTVERSNAGSHADGPNGHCVDTSHWDYGFGSIYTQIHDSVKGTMLHPPPPPNLSPHY